MNDIVKIESAGQELSFTAQEVKDRLCPKATDSELALVMALCQAQNLNPFIKDVHLVKYGDSPLQIVTSKEVFTKRAQANPKFDGFQAGITVVINNQVVQREGSMLVNGWQLIGGWCKVYVKGYRAPIYDEVSLAEYSTGKSMWKSKPATMIRKVALCHALREAFPDDFQGLYGAEEMGEVGEIVAQDQNTTPDGEKTASNNESQQYIVPEFVEIASDEQRVEYETLVLKFADLVEKTTDEVQEAVSNSAAMKQNGAQDYDSWTPEQITDAINQLKIWIEKANVKKATELVDEDIPF